MVDYSVIPAILAIIVPLRDGIRQRHFVIRANAVEGGLTLIFLGISLLVLKTEFLVANIPLPTIPIAIGALAILLTVHRNELGKMLGHGYVVALVSLFVLLVQVGIIKP